MSQPSPAHFFRVALGRPSAAMLVFILSMLAAGAWTAAHDVDDFDQVCLLALFFQMFASSTGFRHQARRGQFDPVLVAGTSRLGCARAHWLLSVAPGFAAWAAIGVVAWWLTPDRAHMLLNVSAVSAIVYVSTVSWALTLPFQPYVGAVAWLGLIFTLAAGHQLHTLREAFMTSSGNWPDTMALTGAVLTAPIFLVANPGVAGTFPLAAVNAASAAAWIAGAVFVGRVDAVLREPS